MPNKDIYRMLYERNVLGMDSTTKEKKQQQTGIQQTAKQQKVETPTLNNSSNATKPSPIPNVKNIIQNRNRWIIEETNARQNQKRIQQQNQYAQPPSIQNNTPAVHGTRPVNTWFDIGREAMDQQLRVWSQIQQNIIQDYNDDIATIRLQEDWVKQQFKNADKVLSRIKWVETAYKQGITDPSQIAMQTWLSVQEVESVIRGDAFKDLELQDRATEEQRRDHEYKMKELRTSVNRADDNMNRNLERLEFDYNNTVEDIVRQAGLQTAQMKKIGALTWQINSTWYMQAIQNIQSEANRNIGRLKTITWRERSDIATARQQLMEDFQDNTVKIKDYFDRNMDVLRGNWLASIQNIQQQYWVATDNATKALRDLHTSMEQQKANILKETMSLQTSFNDRRRQEIDILEKYSQEWDVRKEYANLFLQNPWLANALYPNMWQQINQSAFESFDMNVDFTNMQDIIQQFPNQARAKNNNPGGIKQPSKALADARRQAWINFERGTQPPSWENQANPYTKFATIGEWIEAQWIALSRQWWDINARLQARVGTAEWPRYAEQVMWRAWIPKWTRFEDLTAQQKQNLQSAVIRKESPWLHKLIEESSMKAMWWTWKFDQKEYERVRQILNNNNWVRWAWESVLREANRINDMIDWIFRNTPATVRWTQALIPGTKMYEMKQLIESMKSNIWIDKLLEIKSSWAWLWQVPQSQLETLQSMLWNIRITRNPSNLKADIDDIIKQYDWIITRVNQETEFMKNEYPQYAEILMPRMDQQQTTEETQTRDQWYTPSPHLLWN